MDDGYVCRGRLSKPQPEEIGRRTMTRKLLLILFLIAASSGLFAQQRATPPAQPAPAPPTAKSSAPIDITGNWVALVTNEWRWRMLTPAKGDYAVLPINAAARAIADTWDPARDEAAGEQCRSYGAAVIMQVPGRLRITWENDNALRIDTDAGTQTRLFRFGGSPSPAGAPTWQGSSVAEWQAARGRGREGLTPGTPPVRTGTLKAVTTNLRPGYLRKNGVPY